MRRKQVIIQVFPIQGPFRFPLLVLEWIFSLISFQLGLIFLIRYLRAEKEQRNMQELGYCSLLMGLSFMWFFFIAGDYYASETLESPFYMWPIGSERMALLNLGYLTIMVGGFLCIFFMERYKTYFFKKYFFSMIFFILLAVFMIILTFDMIITQQISVIFWPIFLFFFLIYIIDFSKRVQAREKVVTGVIKFISGFILIAIGYMLTTDFMLEILGLAGRMIGDILQLIAVVFIFYFLITLPPFSEFDWKEKLEQLFIINKTGICLYSYSFKQDVTMADENLISGAISSVDIMLKEITDASGITILKRKEKSILIYPGTSVFGVIFSQEDLNYPKVLLKEQVMKFENLYGNILPNWDGNLDIFKPVENLTKEIFFR